MPPVPKPQKSERADHAATPIARAWMDRVARAGCVMCRSLYGTHVAAGIHHAREGQGVGQRAPHFLSIGLCWTHHQGPDGFHGLGRMGFYQKYRLDEMDLLSMTIEGVLEMDAA